MDRAERRVVLTRRAKELKDKGYSNAAIGRELFLAESSVRTLLKEATPSQ